jgi:hypothetical protein
VIAVSIGFPVCESVVLICVTTGAGKTNKRFYEVLLGSTGFYKVRFYRVLRGSTGFWFYRVLVLQGSANLSRTS